MNRLRRRTVLGLGALLAVVAAAPSPAAALDIKLITVSVLPNVETPAGSGTIATDDGAIACVVHQGVVSGTCEHTYATVSSVTVVWILTPAADSELCSGEFDCAPGASTFENTYQQNATVAIWGFVAVGSSPAPTPRPTNTPSPTSAPLPTATRTAVPTTAAEGQSPGPVPTSTPGITKPSAGPGAADGHPSPTPGPAAISSSPSPSPTAASAAGLASNPPEARSFGAPTVLAIVALEIGLAALAAGALHRPRLPRYAWRIPIVVLPFMLTVTLLGIVASVPTAPFDTEPHELGTLTPNGYPSGLQVDDVVSVPGDRSDELVFVARRDFDWFLRLNCDASLKPYVVATAQRLMTAGWMPLRDGLSPAFTPWSGGCGSTLYISSTSDRSLNSCYRIVVAIAADVSLRWVYAPYQVVLQSARTYSLSLINPPGTPIQTCP